MKESASTGVSWGTLFQGVTPDDSFSIGDCIIVMILNGVVYFVAAVYIGIVWPGEFGIARPWYFLIMVSRVKSILAHAWTALA